MSLKRKLLTLRRRKASGLKKLGTQPKHGGKRQNKRERFILPNGDSIVNLKERVLKMQMELAVAIREKKISLIKKIVTRMLRSSDCRFLAVYRTISSKGARSKGINDLYIPKTNEQYLNLYKKLWEIIKHPNKYSSTPLKRVWLPKPNSTDLRPISVPSYTDRAIQHLYLMVLEVFHEEMAEKNSFGFRPFRSPGWAAKAITLFIWSRKGFKPPKYAIQLDIRKCFDQISHKFLMENVGKTIISGEEISIINPNILNQWLTSGYIDVLGTLTPRTQTIVGIPQGGPISPTMSNMVLNGIEEIITNDNNIQTPEPNKIHLSPEDKIIWKYKGEPVLCTFGLDESEYRLPNFLLRQMGLLTTKGGISGAFLKGSAVNKKKDWSIEYVNENNSISKYRNSLNESKTALFRFADDCIIFANSQEKIQEILQKIDGFLAQRGLEINKSKTKIIDLHKGEKFNFVGFEFAITKTHGKWKVYNYPPDSKIKSLKQKIRSAIFAHRKNPYTCFYMVNSILRGWCNFYSTGNSKKIFSTLRRWIFTKIYRYLFKFYSLQSKFKKSSQRRYKKAISAAVFKTNLLPTPYSLTKSKWFAIPGEYTPIKRGDAKPYFLFNPGYVEVSTPSIITGKSCFHPIDRLDLQRKALFWQRGLLKTLLIKSKGNCKLCGCSLVDLTEKPEIHHIKPKEYRGKLEFTNLAVLCHECHKSVSTAVQRKDLEEIQMYEYNRVLKGVSNAIISSKNELEK
jgi:retron-type reverse transcriptase